MRSSHEGAKVDDCSFFLMMVGVVTDVHTGNFLGPTLLSLLNSIGQ